MSFERWTLPGIQLQGAVAVDVGRALASREHLVGKMLFLNENSKNLMPIIIYDYDYDRLSLFNSFF